MPTQLPAGTNLSSPQIKLIGGLFEGVTEMNVETIGKHLHKDLRRSIYPRSLGLPEQSKEDLLKEISGIIGITTGMDVGHTICY
jgi:hypothetical protein